MFPKSYLQAVTSSSNAEKNSFFIQTPSISTSLSESQGKKTKLSNSVWRQTALPRQIKHDNPDASYPLKFCYPTIDVNHSERGNTLNEQ